MTRTYVVYTEHGIYRNRRYYRTGYTTLRGVTNRMTELKKEGFFLSAVKYIDYANVYEFGMSRRE